MRRFRAPWASSPNDPANDPIEVLSSSSQTSAQDEKHTSKNTNEKKTSSMKSSSDAVSPADDLPAFQSSHQWDPNLPQSTLDALNSAAKTHDAEKIHEVEVTFAEDSPYEEVRAAVRTTDGGEVANTVRAWVLGMIFVTLGSGLNMFLSMRFILLV